MNSLCCPFFSILVTQSRSQTCDLLKLFCVFFLLTDSPVLTSRVAVTVHVLDINEFPPELSNPYETFVCENSKIGQVRLHKKCTRHALVVRNTTIFFPAIKGVVDNHRCCSSCPQRCYGFNVDCRKTRWRGAELNLRGVDLHERRQRATVYTRAGINS